MAIQGAKYHTFICSSAIHNLSIVFCLLSLVTVNLALAQQAVSNNNNSGILELEHPFSNEFCIAIACT